ncbi:MAG TPA: transposase [Kofleriaceae bacterium]|nr:transposase [Kofleriaceae bacterium]
MALQASGWHREPAGPPAEPRSPARPEARPARGVAVDAEQLAALRAGGPRAAPCPGQRRPDVRTWGGKRAGAGRKPRGARAGVAHRSRGAWTRPMPLHVTLRMAPHVYNLRSRRSFRVIAAALRLGGDRFHVRVTQFSVQGNHIHLLVEAPHRRALARAIQGLSIRVAKGLNRMMGRSGRVFDDRYRARILRTPTEVRRAIHYVLGNARKHAAQRGETYAPGYVDPYSSAGAPDVALPPAQTWLLREGWKRAGP